MSEVLKDYREFDTHEIVTQLHELVINNASLLSERNLLGLARRYVGDQEITE